MFLNESPTRLAILIVTALLLTLRDAAGQTPAAKPKPSRPKQAAALQGRCAVIVQPDDKKIRLLQKTTPEGDYMTLISDNQHYLGTAVNFLTAVKIRRIEKESAGVLKFRSVSGRYFQVSLDTCAWGILLFNGRTKPISADLSDIGSSYRAYMKK